MHKSWLSTFPVPVILQDQSPLLPIPLTCSPTERLTWSSDLSKQQKSIDLYFVGRFVFFQSALYQRFHYVPYRGLPLYVFFFPTLLTHPVDSLCSWLQPWLICCFQKAQFEQGPDYLAAPLQNNREMHAKLLPMYDDHFKVRRSLNLGRVSH